MTLTLPDQIIKPFCNSGDETPPIETSSTTVANQEIGFPPLQSTPLNAGGVPVNRLQMNGVFNFYTQQILAIQAGKPYTFNQQVSDLIGGYPEGFILYCDSNKSYQRSLINNNNADFVTNPSFVDDGVNWTSDQFIKDLTVNNINANGNIIANGFIEAAVDMRILGGNRIYFFQNDNNFSTSLRSADALPQSIDFVLPKFHPSQNNTALVSDVNGNLKFENPAIDSFSFHTISKPIAINSWTRLTSSTILAQGKYLLCGSAFFQTQTGIVSAGVEDIEIEFSLYVGEKDASNSGAPPSDAEEGLNTFSNVLRVPPRIITAGSARVANSISITQFEITLLLSKSIFLNAFFSHSTSQAATAAGNFTMTFLGPL